MRLALAMRTADRGPKKKNYLRQTLTGLQRSGGDLPSLQLAITGPHVTWVDRELADLPRPCLHVPDSLRGANANALAALEAGVALQPEMVVLLEDDLAFCADFVGSLSRWLDKYARPDRHVYRCFGFTKPPNATVEAYDWPMAHLRASQVFVFWTHEAADLVDWGREHIADWVPLAPWGRKAPYVTDPTIALDKFVATWALLKWPKTPCVMSHPYFVKHIGDQSSLHSFGLRNDRPFAGESWRYGSAVPA